LTAGFFGAVSGKILYKPGPDNLFVYFSLNNIIKLSFVYSEQTGNTHDRDDDGTIPVQAVWGLLQVGQHDSAGS
jgi:hypothetical protein